MKKVIALLTAATLITCMTACGAAATNTPAEPASETEEASAESVNDVAETEAVATEAPAETETEAVAAFELPEVVGVTHEMPFQLVGIDYPTYNDEQLVRLWFTISNDSDTVQSPSYISAWDGMILTQGDVELNGSITDDRPLEEHIYTQNLLPGTGVMVCTAYGLENENDLVHVTITDDEDVYEFDLDPATKDTVIPPSYEWAPVTDYSWLENADECDYMDFHEKLISYEIIDGKDWMKRVDKKVIRITSEVTYNGEKATTASSYFKPYQDGVSLELGNSLEKNETDIGINCDIEPGQTLTISKVYVLYSNSPIVNIHSNAGDLTGIVYDYAE